MSKHKNNFASNNQQRYDSLSPFSSEPTYVSEPEVFEEVSVQPEPEIETEIIEEENHTLEIPEDSIITPVITEEPVIEVVPEPVVIEPVKKTRERHYPHGKGVVILVLGKEAIVSMGGNNVTLPNKDYKIGEEIEF